MHGAKQACIQSQAATKLLSATQVSKYCQEHIGFIIGNFELICCQCTFKEFVMNCSVYLGRGCVCGGFDGAMSSADVDTQNRWAVLVPCRVRRAQQ